MGYKIKRIYVGTQQVRPSSRLPSAYQEVEYIQSSGTQYINTGVSIDQNTIVEMKFNAQSNSVAYPRCYGANNGQVQAAAREFCLQITTSGPQANIINYSNQSGYRQVIYFTSFAWNTDYTIKHTNTSLIVNGIQQGTCNATTYSISYPLYIFDLDSVNSPLERKPNMKLYWFKIYNGTTLQRDLVPCYRKSDSVVGLYDLANKQFYTNSGSGTFTKGPDL